MGDSQQSEPGRWIQDAVDRYQGRLLRYAQSITGDAESARDVVQETFLRLCRQAPPSVNGHLAQWLFTVARRRALDVHRKENRMRTLTPDETVAQASRETDHSLAAERRDSAAQIVALLAGLPSNQQEVVRLKFQEGLSYREISGVTELSISNVGYLIHTALKTIRRQLAVDGKPSVRAT